MEGFPSVTTGTAAVRHWPLGCGGDLLETETRYHISELDVAAAVETMSIVIDSDEETASRAQFDEYAGDVGHNDVTESISSNKGNDANNPTAKGARVSPF